MRLRDIRKPAGPEPGTPAFGEQAKSHRDQLRERERRGDLRVRTAYKTVDEATRKKQAYLEGD
jgi:hypothetical protein